MTPLRSLQDVVLTRGELIVDSILDVDNVETSIVTLTVRDDTNTALFLGKHSPSSFSCTGAHHVASTSDHDDDTSVELDEVGDLAGSKVDLDRVVDLDSRVRVADSVSVQYRSMTSPEPGLMPDAEVSPMHLAQPVPNG